MSVAQLLNQQKTPLFIWIILRYIKSLQPSFCVRAFWWSVGTENVSWLRNLTCVQLSLLQQNVRLGGSLCARFPPNRGLPPSVPSTSHVPLDDYSRSTSILC